MSEASAPYHQHKNTETCTLILCCEHTFGRNRLYLVVHSISYSVWSVLAGRSQTLKFPNTPHMTGTDVYCKQAIILMKNLIETRNKKEVRYLN